MGMTAMPISSGKARGRRGIAVELGAAGATVYVTGRSSTAGRSDLDRPETVEETAARVTAAGGTGIAVRTDHSDPGEVRALVERIAAEQDGRLDVLVNSVWGGDALTDWEHPLWEQDLDTGLRLLRRAVETHIVTSRFALPLMVARRSGLVVEVTDGRFQDDNPKASFINAGIIAFDSTCFLGAKPINAGAAAKVIVGDVAPLPTVGGTVSFPVTADAATAISVEVYAADGSLVVPTSGRLIDRGTGPIALDVARLPAGSYYVLVRTASGETSVRKFIVER